ncbi:endonuclease domain-containing protein [Rhizobium sp. 2YAF20]|uniref:endonuclease domain-containing protein n=1 Tax=Rhizobium sp. 2YAF20 TaxID=3233027 RepID=UPI003F9A7482
MPHTPMSPRNRANPRGMRSTLTDAELKLWNELRSHRLMGLGFRRQMPIAGYIVDFACPTHRLIVEVDGSQHGNDHRLDYDRARTNRLEQDGWIALRFWNDDVLSDIVAVCDHILRLIGKSHP